MIFYDKRYYTLKIKIQLFIIYINIYIIIQKMNLNKYKLYIYNN